MRRPLLPTRGAPDPPPRPEAPSSPADYMWILFAFLWVLFLVIADWARPECGHADHCGAGNACTAGACVCAPASELYRCGDNDELSFTWLDAVSMACGLVAIFLFLFTVRRESDLQEEKEEEEGFPPEPPASLADVVFAATLVAASLALFVAAVATSNAAAKPWLSSAAVLAFVGAIASFLYSDLLCPCLSARRPEPRPPGPGPNVLSTLGVTALCLASLAMLLAGLLAFDSGAAARAFLLIGSFAALVLALLLLWLAPPLGPRAPGTKPKQ